WYISWQVDSESSFSVFASLLIRASCLGEIRSAKVLAIGSRGGLCPTGRVELTSSSQDFFEQVVAVEKELLDDYARDRLSPGERELFERFYLAHPKRRARAMTAVALVSTLDRLKPLEAETQTSRWLNNMFAWFSGQRLAFGMAALSLLLALGSAWLL